MKLERIVWTKENGKKILHFFSNTNQFVELEYGILFLAYSVLLMWANKAIILLVSQAKLKTILRLQACVTMWNLTSLFEKEENKMYL